MRFAEPANQFGVAKPPAAFANNARPLLRRNNFTQCDKAQICRGLQRAVASHGPLTEQVDQLAKLRLCRPLASGALPVPVAVLAAPVFILAGLGGAALLLGLPALIALCVYFALTVAYSFRIKAAMIADVIALACLYTIRLWVGAAAVGVAVSSWLLLFSIFFFLSLGYLKRYIELMASTRAEHELLSGRGYVRSDAEIVAISGIAAGMVSLLVIILFANAMREGGGYASPDLLWLLVIPLLYWLNRVWMMARRGEVDGDPVAFAIRDPRSIAVGAMMALIVAAAKYLDIG